MEGIRPKHHRPFKMLRRVGSRAHNVKIRRMSESVASNVRIHRQNKARSWF